MPHLKYDIFLFLLQIAAQSLGEKLNIERKISNWKMVTPINQYDICTTQPTSWCNKHCKKISSGGVGKCQQQANLT